MPYISTHVSTSLPREKEISIKEKLGKAIELIPGKSEQWLMVEFRDDCRLYFRGKNDQPAAFVEVKALGNITDFSMTAALTGYRKRYYAVMFLMT